MTLPQRPAHPARWPERPHRPERPPARRRFTAAAGTTNTLTAIGDLKTPSTPFVSGPGQELVASVLAESGGPVYACRCAASNNGSNGSGLPLWHQPQPRRRALGQPPRLLRGAGQDHRRRGPRLADLQIASTAAAPGASSSPPPASPPGPPETGLTITFTNTSPCVAGDVYSWTSTGPTYGSTDLNTALDAVHASPYYLGASGSQAPWAASTTPPRSPTGSPGDRGGAKLTAWGDGLSLLLRGADGACRGRQRPWPSRGVQPSSMPAWWAALATSRCSRRPTSARSGATACHVAARAARSTCSAAWPPCATAPCRASSRSTATEQVTPALESCASPCCGPSIAPPWASSSPRPSPSPRPAAITKTLERRCVIDRA